MRNLSTLPPSEIEGYLRYQNELLQSRIAELSPHPDRVKVVAVSKGVPASLMQCAVSVGICDFGENYAQELVEKYDQVTNKSGQLHWHFIGALQSNKLRMLASKVSLWHSVCRKNHIEALAKLVQSPSILIQVNLDSFITDNLDHGLAADRMAVNQVAVNQVAVNQVAVNQLAAGSTQRQGISPEDLDGMVEIVRSSGCRLKGLMGVGPMGDRDSVARAFSWLGDQALRLGVDELSIGMSNDYELALECGATILRLGSYFFGERQRPGKLGNHAGE